MMLLGFVLPGGLVYKICKCTHCTCAFAAFVAIVSVITYNCPVPYSSEIKQVVCGKIASGSLKRFEAAEKAR